MSIFNIIAILLTLSALFGFINDRYIRLPTTIGLMLIALAFSFSLVILDYFGLNLRYYAQEILQQIDFNATLMQGMLSFLLFAGALHVNLEDLAKQKWIIGILASVGVIFSTFATGSITYFVLHFLGIDIPWIYCLLFGALISPTDPIAVIGIMKQAGASKTLETKIAGESLFNDGVAVVLFIVLLEIASGEHHMGPMEIATLFITEAIGGAIFGLLLGWVGYRMLYEVDNYQVEILLTLAMVTGGYALAMAWHLSAPIAIVVAGLFIGNQGRQLAMSDHTREHIDVFWELIDEILNAILFVLIGLEVLVLTFSGSYLLAGLLLIPIVILVRFIGVGIPITLLAKMGKKFSPHAIKILTWGGLRGGISVALALSLPAGEMREIILAITYIIVIFSITVQGLSIGKLVANLKE